MNCLDITDKLGPFLDDELLPADAERVRAHLLVCCRCREEVASLRQLGVAIAQASTPVVPPALWAAIEQRLSEHAANPRPPRAARRWLPTMRIAAVIAVAAGLAPLIVFVGLRESTARASTIDFGVILDALPLDPQKAFAKFLTLYRAVEIKPADARSYAPDLCFEAPPFLPGGFRRTAVYGLRFDSSPGVAARYERSGELLVAIFHPTVHPEQFGTHKDYPCIVGVHHGHKVEVGDWRLIHVTDETTCHCVLSRLDEAAELPPVLRAVAPATSPTGNQKHGHKP